MGITITSVAKLQSELEAEIEDLGGEVTFSDDHWGYHDGEYRPTYWEVEAYFDNLTPELEEALEDLTAGNGWHVNLAHDVDNEGVLFTRALDD